jgi:hypothetical protein
MEDFETEKKLPINNLKYTPSIVMFCTIQKGYVHDM